MDGNHVPLGQSCKGYRLAYLSGAKATHHGCFCVVTTVLLGHGFPHSRQARLTELKPHPKEVKYTTFALSNTPVPVSVLSTLLLFISLGLET